MVLKPRFINIYFLIFTRHPSSFLRYSYPLFSNFLLLIRVYQISCMYHACTSFILRLQKYDLFRHAIKFTYNFEGYLHKEFGGGGLIRRVRRQGGLGVNPLHNGLLLKGGVAGNTDMGTLNDTEGGGGAGGRASKILKFVKREERL